MAAKRHIFKLRDKQYQQNPDHTKSATLSLFECETFWHCFSDDKHQRAHTNKDIRELKIVPVHKTMARMCKNNGMHLSEYRANPDSVYIFADQTNIFHFP